ncbi:MULTISPECIES: SDR family NAD(P)-dependent oxidoreductase [Alcaligenaceae]|uniref:3-oxoacyl-ACP reductase n=1 Tax=Neopusillimonas maritima TaxID=2026239 RepID=A0ABX9MWD7_9BURK|nr:MULTISPECIES: SDR family oxidoreductase [Alcaligenaceae]MAL01404.1 3-oxoacyl-ACP reductase [Alcaligenaceae bacterium]MAO50225.1 3-oxoacyl-ACP reductase [Pusillimonas sp.]MBC42058.1 3-oxoacyl-ACP reductase [Pusillimonas sp.]QIM47932.1 SDR family oxidoreductase [Pusillimonas sp. DMV24BSW_D]RII83233.1 3-oxoacyl-ACP reductase [Neopusillimonas maritima]|tara:strand:+ start:4611 stop:5438 length:828 start_codon:yes stop_codon:yes gene_type:complete
MKTLSGQVALVSGAGRGIGRAIALKLASAGARLVVNDLDQEEAEAVRKEIEGLGGQAVVCDGDVTAADFGERFVRVAIDNYAGLDIIINNAGYTWDSVIQNMSDEQWYAIIDCHLTAPFRILRAAQPVIKGLVRADQDEGKGHHRKVVNISSITALSGQAGQVNYGAAKAGIIGLTKSLAKEWGRLKTNVNCVVFGLIETRLTATSSEADASIQVGQQRISVGIHPDYLDKLQSGIPLGYAGSPEDAANAVYLLCLPESNYISGETVLCSGGYTG